MEGRNTELKREAYVLGPTLVQSCRCCLRQVGKSTSNRRSYAFLFSPQPPLRVLVSTSTSFLPLTSPSPRHHASCVRSTGPYTTCLLPLRRSAILSRAAKYIVDSSLPYNRAAVKDVPIVLIGFYVILFSIVSSVIVPLTGKPLPIIDTRAMNESKKDEVMQVEDTGDVLVCLLPFIGPSPYISRLTFFQAKDAAQAEHDSWLNDKPRARKLRRKMDLRILPLCAWMYLLNYLDRGNIGNSKLLNSETGDSLIEQTRMTNLEYAIAVSLFAVAYALFEVPSNWIMKRYVRPSRWLATLLLLWGIFTIGFAGVQNFAQVTILRFFIGMFEAGFFPGICFNLEHRNTWLMGYRYYLPNHFLVPGRGAISSYCLCACISYRRWCLWRMYCL